MKPFRVGKHFPSEGEALAGAEKEDVDIVQMRLAYDEGGRMVGFPRYLSPDGSFSLEFRAMEGFHGWSSQGRDHPGI